MDCRKWKSSLGAVVVRRLRLVFECLRMELKPIRNHFDQQHSQIFFGAIVFEVNPRLHAQR